jgi:UDP-N-acetylglucosamine 4,6-dehydratase
MFKNKIVLITGGTGSFGQKMTEFLIKNYKPKKIIIFSRDEFKQYIMSQSFNHKSLRYFLGDVRDKDRLFLATKKVDYIIHAAALKQVPALEYNPIEAIKTNILGAQNIIECALENKVKKIIALSTDKAVNPTNLYGATKLAADKLFVAANNYAGNQKTTFSVVRYGNVGFSRGSVIPVFFKQKEKNQKYFTITDKEMTRFWITLEQSVNFTINSFERMVGGEIFVPKIPSVKVIDIAKAIDPKYKIKIIGIRPGEKLHEVLCSSEDNRQTIEFKDHYVITPAIEINSKKKYKLNKKKEKGVDVKESFVYDSGSNIKFLNVNQIKKKLTFK